MAGIDGQWDSVAQSPMGEQLTVLTLVSTPGGGFAGTNSGALGSIDITDGKLLGDQVSFTMKLTAPFPMTLTAEATLTGDTMEGTLDTGAFGRFPVRATRRV
jgi:hypothetical protein